MLGGIQSGTSRGIDGTAPGRWDTWPGQDACWAPYQWALAHPRGAPKPCRLKNPRAWQHIWACHALSFHSGVMLSPSVTGAAVSLELTEMMQLHREKKKKCKKINKMPPPLLQMNFKTNFFFPFPPVFFGSICACSFGPTRVSQVLPSNRESGRFYLSGLPVR